MRSLDYISPLSTLLPIFVFLLFFREKKELPIWVILLYCIYSCINDSIILYRSDHNLKFSIFLYIFTIIEYLLFSFILHSLIKTKSVKKGIVVCSILFTAFCLYNIFGQPIDKFDSVQASLESILVIAYCIIYFYEQLNQPQISFIYLSYTFWIVTGILIYLSGTFFLYAFATDIPSEARINYWIINLICTMLKNVLFAAAILIQTKPPKTPKIQKPSEPDYQPFLN